MTTLDRLATGSTRRQHPPAALQCGTRGIAALATRFDELKGQLELLHALSHDLVDSRTDYRAIVSRWESRTSAILDEMHAVSVDVAAMRAITGEQLRAKARIWLERWVPEPQDDVGHLAASLCRDLLAAPTMAAPAEPAGDER
jgi:hypothetical protein